MSAATQAAARVTLLVIVFIAVIVGRKTFYVVSEVEQVIITEFGKPIGESISDAGLHMHVPFIQKPNFIDKRILEWDGVASDMPTQDKLYITVDTFGRWRIKDPLMYYEALKDERSAQSRLDDILGSETRNSVAKHRLIEVIRSTKGRKPTVDTTLQEGEQGTSLLLPIRKGRTLIETEVFQAAAGKLESLGIELLDIRFKRVNYNPGVRSKIYDRMVSERFQIANRFRSEGQGEAEIILGDMERDLREIESVAYKQIQEIRGEADAEATKIYASAYNQSPEAVELYQFLKSMETYRLGLDENSTLILSTENELFRYLKGIE